MILLSFFEKILLIHKSSTLNMKEKNKYGQYFTIPEIASFMVNLISHGKHSRVLEPSCGKGVFLTELAKKGFTNVTVQALM